MPIYRLSDDILFPPVEHAEDGLLAVDGDLRPERLLLAYQSGIFPWYSDDEPLMWWSPDPRMVMYPEAFHCARSLQRTIQKGMYRVTLNQAFPEVIRACSATPRPGQEGTWITPEMEEAYIELHQGGNAMSIECWSGDVLAGGLYGIALGGCFFGESMFSHQDDASKVAFHALVKSAIAWGIPFIDCQVPNPHLTRLGATPIPRRQFMAELGRGLATTLSPEAWHQLPEGV